MKPSSMVGVDTDHGLKYLSCPKKKITITLAAVFLCKPSDEAQVSNPQLKIKDYKLKYDLLLHVKQNQHLKNSNQNFGIKINPFWQDVNAPHVVNNSHVREVKIPSFNTIWASVDYDTAAYIANSFFRSADGGKRWRLDSVTWQRVPKQNIPPTAGYAFSSNFNSYAVFQNRVWFTAGDSYGNNYFYRSDDFGQHWQQFPNTLSTPIYDFAFTDKQNGLGLSFDFGAATHEIETYDGGKTWADKSFMSYPMGLSITAIPSTHTLVSTTIHGLTPVSGSSYSNDYGATWKLIDTTSNFSSFSCISKPPDWLGWQS